jgi:DNA mismatch repair protein MutS
MTAGRGDYDLDGYLFTALTDPAAVEYRQEVFRDLDNDEVAETVAVFAQRMLVMRKRLTRSQKLYYQYQRQRWFVDAIDTLCRAKTRS